MPSDVGHARCSNCIRTVTADLSLAFLESEGGRGKLISAVINYYRNSA